MEEVTADAADNSSSQENEIAVHNIIASVVNIEDRSPLVTVHEASSNSGKIICLVQKIFHTVCL